MTKRRSLIATFAFVLALSFALICGITLFGGTLTAYAEGEAPSADSEIKTYNITLTQGTIEADGKTDTSTGSRMASLDVRAGTVVTISAPERSDAVFEKWIPSAVVKVDFEDENSATTTFVMPEGNIWLEPKYKLIRSVTIENGTLEDGTTSKTYTEGDTVKIIAQDKLGGKAFVKWVVTLGEVKLEDVNSTTTTFVMPSGDVKITALYKSEHNLDLVEERPATCTENGTKKHYVCKDCGRKFTDETEAEEITDDSTLVIPKAHKFGAWINEVPATDDATGTKGHKDCEFCHKHFDNDGNEIEDLTLYKTYNIYSYNGTIQADGKTSKRTGGALANLEVREGTLVTIIAEVRSDKVFVKWTVSAVVEVRFEDQNSATTTFVMPKGDVWLDCEYKLIRTVTVENGTLEGGETSGEYTEGDTVKIIAQATLGGKAFVKWLVTSEGVTLTFDDENSPTTTFVMPGGDVAITAVYKGEHNLDLVEERPATCTENGIRRHYVCKDEGCGRKFKDETEAEEITDDSVLIIPKAHKFGEWIAEVPATDEANGTKGHKDCEFCHKHFDNDGNEIEDLTLYKTYSVLLRWGTLQADGKTSTGTGRGYANLDVRAGTVVTIIAEVRSDEVFVKWIVTAGAEVAFKDANSATTTFVMPKGDVWLDCEYKDGGEPAPKHNVTIEGGSSNETKFEAGQTVTIVAGEAPEGKEFDKWIVVSGDVTLENANSASTTFVMPEGAVEIKATYKDKATSGGGEEPGGDDTPSGEIKPAKEDALSGGAIAGIVIASVFAASIAGFAIFWFAIKKKTFADLGAAFKALFDKIKDSVKKK